MTLTFVENVEAGMGPTRVIPGSHLGEVYDHYDADGKWLGLIGEHVKSRVPVTESVPITGPAGSVLITSCAIVHAADENRTARRRPMVLAGYASADTVPYAGIPYRSRYRWRIVSGEPTREIHSDAQRLKMPPDWDAPSGHSHRQSVPAAEGVSRKSSGSGAAPANAQIREHFEIDT